MTFYLFFFLCLTFFIFITARQYLYSRQKLNTQLYMTFISFFSVSHSLYLSLAACCAGWTRDARPTLTYPGERRPRPRRRPRPNPGLIFSPNPGMCLIYSVCVVYHVCLKKMVSQLGLRTD